MPIIYKTLTQLGINPVEFRILTPNHDRERVLFFQCGGKIDAEQSVKNSDTNLASEKFKSFFKRANEKKCSLAITPEYSCPWSVLEDILVDESKQPDKGALWVIGCESITPQELEILKDKYNNDKSIWHYEDIDPSGNQVFVSPVVYLFYTDENKLCVLVQFKSHDMGGTFERDNLIKGNTRYIIENTNDQSSIKLFTLICAESMVFDFNPQLLNIHVPYLIIHLQLNKHPYHHNIRKYRSDLYGAGNSNIEILSANWAKGFSINEEEPNKDYGGSAFYMQTNKNDQPCQTDDCIQKNHNLGSYLRYNNTYRYYAYLFSPNEYVYEFLTTKASQVNSPVQNRKRTGIEIIQVFSWDNDNWKSVDNIEDNIKSSFNECGCDNEIAVCNRERLLSLSTGNISEDIKTSGFLSATAAMEIKSTLWHLPQHMFSYNLNTEEKPQGTLAKLEESQETQIDSTFQKFKILQNIVSDKNNFPKILDNYKSTSHHFNLNESVPYKYNLGNNSSKSNATVVYIGEHSAKHAKVKFSKISSVLYSKRLVVWYSDGTTYKNVSSKIGKISEPDNDQESIA